VAQAEAVVAQEEEVVVQDEVVVQLKIYSIYNDTHCTTNR